MDTGESIVGHRGNPYEVYIERGKVREFAKATKAKSGSFYSDERPVVPPTFLASAAHWLLPGSSVLEASTNFARALHGEQEFVFYKELPRAGTLLIAQQTVQNQYTKKGRRGGILAFTVVQTEFRTQEGELVAEGRNTVIITSKSTEN